MIEIFGQVMTRANDSFLGVHNFVYNRSMDCRAMEYYLLLSMMYCVVQSTKHCDISAYLICESTEPRSRRADARGASSPGDAFREGRAEINIPYRVCYEYNGDTESTG